MEEEKSKIEQWWEKRQSDRAEGFDLISEVPLGQLSAAIRCPVCFGHNFTNCSGCVWSCYCEDLTKTFLSLTKNEQEDAIQKTEKEWKDYQNYLKREKENIPKTKEEWEEYFLFQEVLNELGKQNGQR